MTSDDIVPRSTCLTDGWMSRTDLARELGLTVDTLARWETRRIGPPCIRIGRKVLYRIEAVQDWMCSQERGPMTKGARR
ncbi:MAG: transcriptional regulator [Paracoccus sp. (in: a-proteobacteria)]|nr:transcriptional regulator [Paracoccus sp. (in: a-proteobacteria)]